ncbi:MAG TPA: energy transducer TonB [Candidatus Kapabacteria bacterium]|nr:energy transducer TonB [Candidatus Kapabacteria bacterium]
MNDVRIDTGNDTHDASGDDRTLVIARVIHRLGGGIRFIENRNFTLAFAISLGIHALIIGLYWLAQSDAPALTPRRDIVLGSLDSLVRDTSFIAIDMRQVTVLQPGGGGGAPDSDEPVGRSKKGDPHATPKYVPKKPPQPNAPDFDPKTPTRIKPVDRPTDDRRVATTDRDTAKGPTTGYGERGQHLDGKGTRDAGGSGGAGIGRGVGLGIGDGEGLGGRGWIRRPSSRAPGDLPGSGTVRLAFTVLPNGEITNIQPIKRASPALVELAVSRLRAAKVRPLSEDVPQVPVRSAITFTFSYK